MNTAMNTGKKPTIIDEALLWLADNKGSIFYSEHSAAVEVVHNGHIIHKEHPIGNGHDARSAAMRATRLVWEEMYPD